MTPAPENPASLLAGILGRENVETDPAALENAMENTLGLMRHICCIVRPGSTQEVKTVVEAAGRLRRPVYPISRGQNIGYGDRLPAGDGHILMDLGRMDRIREFDAELGTIVLEPGVTQMQLYRFLCGQNTRYRMDVTGAGLDASIVGNTLEGGFGHTPVGFRRGMMSDLEVVAGTGRVIRTGDLLDAGPGLSGLFVQSGFGVVTAMKIRLMRMPDHYKSFIIKVPGETDLYPLVDRLRTLRQNGTLTSLVHIANATRSLMSTRPLPRGFEHQRMSCRDAMAVMNQGLVRAGYWTAMGGIYGSAGEVRAKEREIRRAVRGLGAVMAFSGRKIQILRHLGRFSRNLDTSLEALAYAHRLGQGIPDDRQVRHISWRIKAPEHMGLKWISPLMPARGGEVRKVVETCGTVFRNHGADFPMTITLVLPDQAISVLNITFDKTDPESISAADDLYQDLRKGLDGIGVAPYRLGISETRHHTFRDPGKAAMLARIKQAFDPNRIIAPGRYGL